jgi:tetratricopeptide (TPR) repeat protein
MKKLLTMLVVAVCVANAAFSQNKNTTVMPDVNRLMAMSPAERQKYTDSIQKANSEKLIGFASQQGLAIDETVLPGIEIKPPVKDIARLALIPSRPPTRTELVAQVQKSKEQLQTVMPKTEVAAVEKFSSQQSLAAVHEASIGRFYNNEPEKALWLMMKVAIQQPDSVVVWNNLAAMYNMVGLQHRAVSMLQYCLQQEAGSSLILNNLAQSYMGLGELVKARKYFGECLAIDSLNPDANHSMGLLNMFVKEFDEAANYFNRELSVAMRSSTLACMAKMGKKINLRALQQRRNALNRREQKDFFEEINLGKYSIPTYPATVIEAYRQASEFIAISKSMQAEAMFWLDVGRPSEEEIIADGKKRPGLYASLVAALLDELHEEFTPEYLSNNHEDDLQKGLDIIDKYSMELVKIKCPQAPAGSSMEAQRAFEIKCCKKLREPVINKRLKEYGEFWRPKVDVAQQRWKSYINQLIAIVQLDPSAANQLMVYRQVGAYFSFLSTALLYSGTAEAVNYSLPLCDERYDLQEAEAVILADHNWRVQCPAWLNIEVDVEVGKIKADCDKYGLEVGNGIVGQYEYEFKTGRSTLAAGYGVKAKFLGGIGKASIKELAFITFDNNNQVADFGVRSKFEVGIGDTPINIGPVKVGGTVAGLEGEYQYGINSGHTTKLKGKGVLADFVKYATTP